MPLTGTEIAAINWVIKGVEWVCKGGRWIAGKFHKPDPLPLLKKQQELRKQFQEHLPHPDGYGVCGELIIRDIKRHDSYPRVDDREKGISPWFGVEVKGLYHRGLEVFIGVRRRIKKDMYGEWKFTDQNGEDTELVYTVGRIPFKVIEHVDWEGDDNYPMPHVYCRFEALKGQPYEEIVYFAKFPGSEDLYEVKDFRPSDKEKSFWFLNN
jgi:hypothetical protein